MTAKPLVAVLVRVPLLLEGLRDALARVAEVDTFEVRDGDAAGLLASIRPDAVVVDDDLSPESIRNVLAGELFGRARA